MYYVVVLRYSSISTMYYVLLRNCYVIPAVVLCTTSTTLFQHYYYALVLLYHVIPALVLCTTAKLLRMLQ